jgi:hypothetical protein
LAPLEEAVPAASAVLEPLLDYQLEKKVAMVELAHS